MSTRICSTPSARSCRSRFSLSPALLLFFCLLVTPLLLMGSSTSALAGSTGYTVNGEPVHWSHIFVGTLTPKNFSGNTLKIFSGSDDDLNDAYGGMKEIATLDKESPVTDNKVFMSGGLVKGFLRGGGSATFASRTDIYGPVKNNHVVLSGGTVNKSVQGGYVRGWGSALGNSVTITGGSVGWDVVGALAVERYGEVTGNKVTISGGSVAGDVWGGSANFSEQKNNVSNNEVIISGGKVGGNVTGGYAAGSGHVIGNKVTIIGAGILSASQSVTGGFAAGYGDAGLNEVRIESGSVEHVIGGYSDKGYATHNTVTITGRSLIWGSVYGGKGNDTATNNTVNISGNPAFDRSVSVLYGAFSGRSYDFVRQNNTLNLGAQIVVKGAENFENWNFELQADFKDGTMLAVAEGAASLGDKAKIGLRVAPASERLLKGDSFTLINKFSGTYDYTPTTVVQQGAGLTLYDFSVKHADDNTNLTATVQKTGRATDFGNGNTYIITPSDAGLDYVAGGYADGVNAKTATNNTVLLAGNPGTAIALYGGYAAPGVKGDVRTGNMLMVSGRNLIAKSVQNFQNYHFYLTPSTKPRDTVLNVQEGVDLRGVRVGVGVSTSGTGLANGNSVTLLKSNVGLNTDGSTSNSVTAMQGISLLHKFDLSTTHTELKATLRNSSPNPGTKSISQGQTVSNAALGTGSALVADGGMGNAMTATGGKGAVSKGIGGTGRPVGLSGGSNSSYGLEPFAAVSAGSLHYKVGDGADVKGVALMAGLAKRWQGDNADFLLGAFFEAGWSGISSYTNSPTGSLTGTTNADYLGGGILARTDFTGTVLKGLYAEASVRMGHLNQKYNNYDLRNAEGRAASYELGAAYYGLHAGLGYIWNFSDSLSLDISAKYFWNHQQGGDVRIAGDPYSFKAVNSHRVLAGARLNYAVNEKLTAYTGAAWEHEFDGSATVTAYGLNIPSPTATGSTGVGELGLRFKPFAETSGLASTFSVDLSVQGYLGMREGVMGNLTLGWEF